MYIHTIFTNYINESLLYTKNLKSLFLNNGFKADDVLELEKCGYFSKIKWSDSNTLIVYRSVSIPVDEVKSFYSTVKNGIGQYWSFDSNIKSIWGNMDNDQKYVNIRCVGHLELNNIDWNDMIHAINDDFYHFCYEYEIRALDFSNKIDVIECKVY